MPIKPLTLCALALALAPPAALACGGLFTHTVTEGEARFAGQAVLIDRQTDRIDWHLRLTLAPGAEDIAWVLPVPRGAALSLGDAAVFEALEDLTAPQISITRDTSGGGGCSAADGAAGPRDVELIERGTLGDYAYAIIASADAAAAVTWLRDNDYAVPDDLTAALQPYADQGLDLLGVRLLRPDAARPTDPTPLVISQPDAGGPNLPGYPLGLSALSAGDTLEIIIYVVGPGRATVQDSSGATVAELADELAARTDPTAPREYSALIDHWQAEADGPLWITEAVLDTWPTDGPLAPFARDGAHLTRLRARLPAAHIRDLRLGFAGRDLLSNLQHRHIGNDDSCRAAGGPGLTSSLALLVLLLGARRRRRCPAGR